MTAFWLIAVASLAIFIVACVVVLVAVIRDGDGELE